MPPRRSPRKKPAQERSKETVRALLQAAARILEQEGYERTSVNRIADVAGVSVGSLYQYFPTKEALVAAVAHKLSDDMLAVFQEGLHEDAMLPFHDAVRAVVVRTVRAFRVNPRLRQIIVEELPESVIGSTEFDAWFAEALGAYFEFHRDHVFAPHAERPRDAKLAIALLMAAVEAAAKVASLRGDPEDVVVDELTHMVLGYVL
jgi:AcrR family transcriptional regulator